MYRTLDLSFKNKGEDNYPSSKPYTSSQYKKIEKEEDNVMFYDKTIQPSILESENDKVVFLNKDKITIPKSGYNFIPITENKTEGKTEKKTSYISLDDPRLYDASRNITTFLDSVPLGQGGIINFNELYTDKYKDYGKPYKNYEDINIGNIIYRTEVGVDSEPFKNPNFVIKSGVKYDLFRNPMDNVQAEYRRIPFSREEGQELTDLEKNRMDMTFREDLMATQDLKINSRKWNYRWKQPVKRID